nr:uncharacterized protein LOC122270162 [Parasteatoda tepidariorum]
MAENEQVFSSAHRNKSGTSTPSPSFILAKCPNYDLSKAKFLILSSTEKKLSSMSPFLVQKSLETHIGNPKNVRQMPSGDLLVETNSEKQSASLLKLHQLGNVNITVTPHNTLNISKGVISDNSLQSLPTSEIIEGLSSQGVIDARHITIKKGTEIFTTQHLILTFNNPDLPTDIKAGYKNCKVRPYIPNPLRCFKCQKFGHATNNCRGKETCSRCGQTGHTYQSCSSPEKCVNCNEPHSANSRRCSKWKQEKQILNIKVMQNLSYYEAKTKFLSSQPRPNVSYAAIVSSPKATKSIGIQCDVKDTETQTLKTISPKKAPSSSNLKSAQAKQQKPNSISHRSQAQSSVQSTSTQLAQTQNNAENSQYLKLTPQLVSVLHKKLTHSPLVSKPKYVSKSRQNRFNKNRKKLSNTQEQCSESDAMSTDENCADEHNISGMIIEKGMVTPSNLSPKKAKSKINK